MKKLKNVRLLILLFSISYLQAESIQLDKYDSLFIQASAASYKDQYLVEPARAKLIAAGKMALPFLVSKIDTKQPREYQALKEIFKKINPDLAAEQLKPLISQKNRETYSFATELLGLSGGKSAAPLLYPDLEHDSIWVRLGAIRSLGNMQDSSAENLLLKQISHSDYKVRWFTAAALGKIATAKALNGLLDLSDDSLQTVKMTAYQYLKNNFKKLPDLRKFAKARPENLIIQKLNYRQSPKLYADSSKYTGSGWQFIKGDF